MRFRPPVLCCSPDCRRDPETGELAPAMAAFGLRLCFVCRDRIVDQLGDTAAFYDAELSEALPAAAGDGVHVGGTFEPGLPFNPAVADCRAEIRGHLRRWTSHVYVRRGLSAPRPNVLDMARFLDRHVDWLAACPHAARFAVETGRTWRKSIRAAFPRGSRRVPIGGCPMPGCAGELEALLRPAGDKWPSLMLCGTDPGHCWTPDQWRALAPYITRRTTR